MTVTHVVRKVSAYIVEGGGLTQGPQLKGLDHRDNISVRVCEGFHTPGVLLALLARHI